MSSPSCGRDRVGPHRGRHPRARRRAKLAVTNAGTIPDRGLYGVHLVDGGGRVGELDEEMVYEARAGQTFMLGASTWRIEEITRDRVLVSPAPGVPGGSRSGKGRAPAAVRARGSRWQGVARAGRPAREQGPRAADEEHSLDEQAARNLLTFLSDQQAATGAVPSDRTVVVERLQGRDRRLARLHPHAVPRSRVSPGRSRSAPGSRLARTRGAAALSDDGTAIHPPDSTRPRRRGSSSSTRCEIEGKT